MNIPMRRVLAVFLLVLVGLVLISVSMVSAQTEAPAPTPVPGVQAAPPSQEAPNEKDDARILLNNKPLKGAIKPASEDDWYFFFGTEGQHATLTMTALSGGLDGYMQLYDPLNETYLAADDDSGGGLNPSIQNFRLPKTGRFKVILSSWGGNSSGNYNIKLTITEADVDDNRLMTSGKLLNGTISPANDRDVYFFWVTAGQKATIQLNKKGGSLDTYLELYDMYSNYVASDDDSGAGSNSLLSNVNLTQTGLYHIVARSYSASSSGKYTVKVTLTKPNLALGKYSTAWNWHAPWYLPEYGNDGNQSSRWAGDYGTNWWWVDLGSQMTFSQVKINWEAAYAAEYFVGWSNAPNCLGTYDGFYYTASSAGWKTHNLGSRTARCVAVRMDVPVYWATNYSFWEFEVYNLVGNGSPLSSQPDSITVDVVPEADFGEANIIQLELTPANAQE